MATDSQVPAQRGIWRRKPIVADEEDGGLERQIGPWQLTAIGIGAIIGAGIFTLAGTVANGTAGPAVTISFIIAGIASACAALSYAEFGGMTAGWLGLHLRLCGARRVRGMADPVGPAAGIHRDRGGGGDRHLRLLLLPAGQFRSHAARLDARSARNRRRPPGRRLRDRAVPADRVPAQPRDPHQRSGRDDSRGRQGGHHSRGDHRRRLLRQHRQPLALPALRLRRGGHRRGDRLLCGVRLRRDEHGGGGVQGRAADPARDDSPVAGHLHGPLPAGLHGAHRHAALRGDRPGERLLDGVPVRRTGALRRHHRDRCDRRHPHGALLVHARRVAGAVCDQPRRPASDEVRPDEPQIMSPTDRPG